MSPYYEKDGLTIYCGDFRDHLDLFREADLVIADPPYGETSLGWDKWPHGWPGELIGYVRKTCPLWCFGSARMFLEHASEFVGWRFNQDIVWEKQNGSGLIVDRFKRVHESAYLFIPRGGVWNDVYKDPQRDTIAPMTGDQNRRKPAHFGPTREEVSKGTKAEFRLQRSVIRVSNCHGYAVNETQKPEGIVMPLIRYSCPPGGLILSPFMGSGTDLVCARAHGCGAIGFDKREEQCEAAALRLSQGVLSFAEALP